MRQESQSRDDAGVISKEEGDEEMPMDFIERIFGISPDGGSGSFELMLIVVPILCLVLLYWYRSKSPSQ
jgi:hypothetical protein